MSELQGEWVFRQGIKPRFDTGATVADLETGTIAVSHFNIASATATHQNPDVGVGRLEIKKAMPSAPGGKPSFVVDVEVPYHSSEILKARQQYQPRYEAALATAGKIVRTTPSNEHSTFVIEGSSMTKIAAALVEAKLAPQEFAEKAKAREALGFEKSAYEKIRELNKSWSAGR